LFRIEKELRGLIDGQWLTPSGRTNWTELVKGAEDVHDMALAAVQLEAALKSLVLDKSWFNSEEAAVKRRGKRGRPKKLSDKDDKKAAVEYDWAEMKEAGILEDMTIGAGEDDEADEDKEPVCWVGGHRVVPCSLRLSSQTIRNAVLSGRSRRCLPPVQAPCVKPSLACHPCVSSVLLAVCAPCCAARCGTSLGCRGRR
jgi:hypothetical protein